MAYLTKDTTGLVQLWNNKPEYNKKMECFQAWLPGKEGYHNEVGIDVTGNDYFRNLFEQQERPCVVDIVLRYKVL